MVVFHSNLATVLCLIATTSAIADQTILWSDSIDVNDSNQFDTNSFAKSHRSKQFSQKFLDGYSFLKHYGGNGPYSDRQSYGIDRNPPAGCKVDQVVMIKRHGERYPDTYMGGSIEKTLSKLENLNFSDPDGDLAFLEDWKYFAPSECYYGAETTTGPYAGLLDAFKHGKQYQRLYGHLWDSESIVPIFAGDYARVIDTAHKFGEGFFGTKYADHAAMNIISENYDQGADSLTPHCPKDDYQGCQRSYTSLPQFKVAAKRLNSQYPDLNLTSSDVFNLMLVAAFELNVRPSSPWIEVFTLDEWVTFGYSQDLWFYYCAGAGDKYMSAVGSVYLNASLTLLNQGPSAGALSFNFAHDTNLVPIITALGILNPTEDLPLDHIPFGNPFSIGNIMPMGGHLTTERLSCDATALSPAGTYVRLVLNEAVVPFKSCQSGPGYSCPLSNYTSILSKSLPNFVETCDVPESYPQHLNFWWNYTTSTEDNNLNKTKSCH